MGQLTRNPNLMFAEVSDSSHLKSQSSEDELVGERPEWWWTGPKPKVSTITRCSCDSFGFECLPLLTLVRRWECRVDEV